MNSKVLSLRLEPSRSTHALNSPDRHRILVARRSASVRPTGWPTEIKRAFLDKLKLLENVSAAARAVGRTGSAAVAERARDSLFAAAWDAVLDPKLELMETLLLDRTISRLGPAFDPTKLAEAAIRHDANICMWFLESRMPQRYGKGRSLTPVSPAGAPSSNAVNPATEAKRVDQLIAAAEQRIAEAEACLRGDAVD